MQAALAMIANEPASARRRRKATCPWVLLASVGAHLLALAGLIAGADVMPHLVEPPVLSVELISPVAAPQAPAAPKPEPPKVKARASATAQAAVPNLPATLPAAPSTPGVPAGAVAPPGFTARGLTGGGDALRRAARDGIGCRNVDLLALTRAERDACAEALGEKHRNGPALYAVIDPDKKAAFDGACKKDDDWCLYRTGKGPYPGLIPLGKKKKSKGWD
jgi:hypothetical protein